jgi:long-subunit fatty acid transport protein
MALISAEYEGLDYASTKMYGIGSFRNEFSEDNQYMRTHLAYASNIRVGVELRVEQLSFRAGYAFYQSPEKAYLYDQHIISTGMGYASVGGFFVDAAFSCSPSYKYDYALYGDTQQIMSDAFIARIILSLGFRF